jgi:hypothetical protein
MAEWEPYQGGVLSWRVARLAYADDFCSGYNFARKEGGQVMLFLTKRGAQMYADKLNKEDSRHD